MISEVRTDVVSANFEGEGVRPLSFQIVCFFVQKVLLLGMARYPELLVEQNTNERG